MKFRTVILQILSITIVSTCLLFHELVLYGIEQGYNQIYIVSTAKNIEELLKDDTLQDSVKRKLQLIQEIKKFATDSLGLDETNNYTTYFDQKGKPLIWIVTACKPFSFEPYEWWFPVIGNVSYKGFFDKTKAEKEASRLKKINYDVDISRVGAWSTLGWFKDPVLSSMLTKPEGQLVELIIHELTHSTIYVKSDVEFNENLANFVAYQGTVQFLHYKYGDQSNPYQSYIIERNDESIYNKYVIETMQSLDSLYKVNSSEALINIGEKKKNRIDEFLSRVYFLPIVDKKIYARISKKALISGNAFFMSFQRYDAQQALFEKEFNFRYKGNMRLYIKGLKLKFL